MMKIKITLAVLFVLASSVLAIAQQNQARVVSSCGTTGITYTAGGFGPMTVDTNGNLCSNGSGGGGGTATNLIQLNSVALGSPSAYGTSPGAVNVIGTNAFTTNLPTVAPSVAPVTATNPAVVVDLRPDSPGIIALGQTTKSASVPVTVASDQGAISVAPVGTSLAANGIAPVVGGSAISSLVLKASPGNLYSVYAECSAACWLMVFNSTTAPSNGSTTAGIASGNMQECVSIASGGVGSINYSGAPPEVFSVGITAVISSTTCATLTLATTGFIHGVIQ
jgi:hypothetical protein